MMYDDICSDNRLLYAALEKLSRKIKRYEELNYKKHINVLKYQKDRIRERIDINLDILEEIWQVHGTRHNDYSAEIRSIIASDMQIKIIEVFNANPDLHSYQIAEILNIKDRRVHTALTRYLRKQFKLTA